jgi:transaldolase
MNKNPLLQLEALGQSIWLDFLSRGMLVSGELVSLIQEDGVTGVTSNPAIFEKAIAGSSDYDDAIKLLSRRGLTTPQIYQELVVDDIQMTADLLRPVYERTNGGDGFVSLEVSPHLAHDTAGTLIEARELWERVDRPNLFIKVPGTWEGLPAIRQLVSEGINVNVTLLFGLPRYRAVAEAYLDGLAERAARGLPLERVASVASFFLSRLDVLVDPLLAELAGSAGDRAQVAASLKGETAVACAKLAREMYHEIQASDRCATLAARGARPQRLLWASTGTKNPDYSDLKYLEPLIGPDTVNTAPLETLAAYRDHGHPADRLDQGVCEATTVLERLGALGIDLALVTQQLEDEGVVKFTRPFDSLMQSLEQKRSAALG